MVADVPDQIVEEVKETPKPEDAVDSGSKSE